MCSFRGPWPKPLHCPSLLLALSANHGSRTVNRKIRFKILFTSSTLFVSSPSSLLVAIHDCRRFPPKHLSRQLSSDRVNPQEVLIHLSSSFLYNPHLASTSFSEHPPPPWSSKSRHLSLLSLISQSSGLPLDESLHAQLESFHLHVGNALCCERGFMTSQNGC
jgi:hypothetical protein